MQANVYLKIKMVKNFLEGVIEERIMALRREWLINIIKIKLRLKLNKLMPDVSARNGLQGNNTIIAMSNAYNFMYKDRAKKLFIWFM